MSDPTATGATGKLRDRLLDSLTGCIALMTASECGLIAQLEAGPVARENLRMPKARGTILLHLLEQNDMIGTTADGVSLRPGFKALWVEEGDALLARAEFTLLAARDMIDGRTAYFDAPEQFFANARTFSFFCYDRARSTGLGSLQDTEQWVSYVSALNAAEAPQLADLLPLEDVSRVLEIGGNAGGFARELLARHPNLHVTIMDLPAVCALGERGGTDTRLAFSAGDARRDPWPLVAEAVPDMILFKSVLHDWDAAAAREMLQRAADHVAPGGHVAVVERGRIETAPETPRFSSASNLVFADYYRAPEWYVDVLQSLALTVEVHGPRHLDLPFYAIVGRR